MYSNCKHIMHSLLARIQAYMLQVDMQQVCMSVSFMLHKFIKYRDHYTSNIIVVVPMQHFNYYVYENESENWINSL